jgi:hypothetical protein
LSLAARPAQLLAHRRSSTPGGYFRNLIDRWAV